MFGLLKNIFKDDSKDIVNALKQGATIIDVRSANEFQSGSVKGAINIPHTEISAKKSKLSKMKQPIVLCCASGMRSGMALQELKKMGFDQTINGKTHQRVASLHNK
jgi:phage shock protein E